MVALDTRRSDTGLRGRRANRSSSGGRASPRAPGRGMPQRRGRQDSPCGPLASFTRGAEGGSGTSWPHAPSAGRQRCLPVRGGCHGRDRLRIFSACVCRQINRLKYAASTRDASWSCFSSLRSHSQSVAAEVVSHEHRCCDRRTLSPRISICESPARGEPSATSRNVS